MEIAGFDSKKSVLVDIGLEHGWYFPFAEHTETDESDFMNKVFRSFDTLNPSTDRV